VTHFYRFADPLFQTVTRDSGILNMGYAADPTRADLAQAQRDLVRRCTRSLPDGGHWLEVGCGWGGPALLLARERPQLQITGLDLSAAHLGQARAAADRLGLAGRVSFRLGDAQALPFPDARFHGVYSIESAFHYPRKRDFVHQARRVLAAGGRLAVADIIRRPQHSGTLARLGLAPNMRLGAMQGLFSADDWRSALVGAGFEDVTVEDITRQTFGLLGRWAQRMHQERTTLQRRYPRALLAYYELGLERLGADAQRSPVGYLLIEGRRGPRS